MNVTFVLLEIIASELFFVFDHISREKSNKYSPSLPKRPINVTVFDQDNIGQVPRRQLTKDEVKIRSIAQSILYSTRRDPGIDIRGAAWWIGSGSIGAGIFDRGRWMVTVQLAAESPPVK